MRRGQLGGQLFCWALAGGRCVIQKEIGTLCCKVARNCFADSYSLSLIAVLPVGVGVHIPRDPPVTMANRPFKMPEFAISSVQVRSMQYEERIQRKKEKKKKKKNEEKVLIAFVPNLTDRPPAISTAE